MKLFLIKLKYKLYALVDTSNRWRRFVFQFLFLSLFSMMGWVFVYQNVLNTKLDFSIKSCKVDVNGSIHTHDRRQPPYSRSAMEFDRIQVDRDIMKSMFLDSQTGPEENIDFTQPLSYKESIFSSAPVPIIWLDMYGDIHWNRAAQYETLNYILEKQFPGDLREENFIAIIDSCLRRQLFILDQWSMGFFSRHHCFIEHFGQTLYSPSMVLLLPRQFLISQSWKDDFLSEGITRYFQPVSLCSAYLHHPVMTPISDALQNIVNPAKDRKMIQHIRQLLERDEQTIKYIFSNQIWNFGYDHVPHRRWLFDRNRYKTRKMIHYNSSIDLLIDHSNEHIYHYNDSSLYLTDWKARNSPPALPKDVLAGTTTNLTLNDQIFTSFLRYMFLLFFSPLTPRIQTLAKLLAHHWSEYLSDRNTQPYETSLSNMAVLFIRRGDKMPEDSFWQKHGHWRNISMYVKGLVDEEQHRSKNYSSIFILTDDRNVMKSIEEYSRVGLANKTQDEQYARRHLHGRQILYNVFAPQDCFDPFIRVGFDQFLVNVQFIVDHASLVVGHTDSNVGRYLEELIYVNRQHQAHVQTSTYVINAPDTLD